MREIISSTSESLHKKSRSCEYCVAVLSFSIKYRLRQKKVCYCLSSSITRCHSFRWGHEGSQPSGWTSCEEEEAETGKPRPVRYEWIHCSVVALYECFSAVGCFSTDTRLSLSLLVPVITNLFLSVFSVSLSPAAVREIDEVSSPTRIHLDAAAARPLLWYDSTYSSSHVIYLP